MSTNFGWMIVLFALFMMARSVLRTLEQQKRGSSDWPDVEDDPGQSPDVATEAEPARPAELKPISPPLSNGDTPDFAPRPAPAPVRPAMPAPTASADEMPPPLTVPAPRQAPVRPVRRVQASGHSRPFVVPPRLNEPTEPRVVTPAPLVDLHPADGMVSVQAEPVAAAVPADVGESLRRPILKPVGALRRARVFRIPRQRLALRQAVILSEVLGRPRAYDL